MWVLSTYTSVESVLKQSDTEAYLWGRKAANKGLAKAEYAVGCTISFTRITTTPDAGSDYTEIGIGIKQDMDSAKRWYMRAAGRSLSRSGRDRLRTHETVAQQHKRAMQRLTELNNAKNAKSKKTQARPTRHEAQNECLIM